MMKKIRPLIMMFKNEDGKITTELQPEPGDNYGFYGLILCDLVRLIAQCFHVEEGAVWEKIDKERSDPTRKITIHQRPKARVN